MDELKNQLASSLGRADEAPNIALAESVCKSNNKKAVKELISLVQSGSRALRSYDIKVIYEIGERKPELITPYAEEILALLHDKDNRMKWGAMSALSAISRKKPELLVDHLPYILDAMDNGSVIT